MLPVGHPASALEFQPLFSGRDSRGNAIGKTLHARRRAVQPELQLEAIIPIDQDGVHLIVQFSHPPESHHLI